MLFLRLEIAQDLQWHIGLQGEVFLATDAPASLPLGLQQEDVVAVEVRTNAAAIAGPGNHEVVQACVRHKPEPLHEFMDRIDVQIHALDQQGPAGPRQGGQLAPAKRAMLELPSLLAVDDQARLDLFAAGQVKQRRPIQQRRKSGNGLPDQQGFLLPVTAHEGGWRKAAEQLLGQAGGVCRVGGSGLLGGHGTIVR